MSDQIGITGKAKRWGIPAAKIGWGTSFTQYEMDSFGEISKNPDADIDKSNDKDGELQGQNRRNKRFSLSFSAKPTAANAAAVDTLVEALPVKGDMVFITCADDTQVATGGTTGVPTDTCLVESARSRWTSEGELIVDWEVTKYVGKVFVALS